MVKKGIYLSVVIPSYNEKENLKRKTLESVYDYLSRQQYSWELVLSDDGSTDGTVEALRKFADKRPGVVLIENPHRGKGPTVYAGMMASSGENRLFTDADQATPITEVEKLLPYVQRGYDVVIGSREGKGAKRQKEPLYRHLMGRGWNLFVRALAIPGIKDTQCGFKLFSDKATEELFPRLFVYKPGVQRQDAYTGAFDVELLYIARKRGYRVAEVPVVWTHFKTKRVNAIKDSTRMLLDLLRIRAASFQGKYK